MNATATERVKRIITINLDEDEARALKVIMSHEFKWDNRSQTIAGWSYGVPMDFIAVLDAAINGKNLGTVHSAPR